MFKKSTGIFALAAIILSVLLLFSGTAGGSSPVSIQLDGSPVRSDVSPYIDSNDRTIVPVRFVSEELGFKVGWDPEKKKVEVSDDSSIILLNIGEKSALVNGERVTMDAPAVINHGRTMVPVRFVAETFGIRVSWSAESRTVFLSSKVMPPEEKMEGVVARVTGSFVNIRTGPGTDYPRVAQLPSGTEINLSGKTGEWYQLRLPGGKGEELGWIAGWLVEEIPPGPDPGTPKPSPAPAPAPEPEPEPVSSSPFQGISLSSAARSALVVKPSLNVYSAPSDNSSIIGGAGQGDWLEIISERDRWYQVRLDNGREGWLKGWLVATRYAPPGVDASPVADMNPGAVLGSWNGKVDGQGKEGGAVINGIKVQEIGDGLLVQVTANSSLDITQVFRLSGPSRLVLDFDGLLGGEDYITPIEVNRSPVIRLRGSQYEEDKVRLVVDLKENIIHSITRKNDGKLLEVLIQPVFPLEKTVVIDPGHGTIRSGGGTDPGAIGPTGHTERDVVTGISRLLGERLLNMGYTVVFTREEVTGFSLGERAQAASLSGGVFVSVHANAHPSREAEGTETFYPGTAGGASPELIATSRALARNIQDELVALLRRSDRGVKQANFAVLRDNYIPAVLVEVAFISNPEEEKLLVQLEFQDRAAQAIAQGIEKYWKER